VRRSTLILVALFLLSLPAVTTRLYASDEVEAFVWLRSVAFDHDADFTNEYQYFYDHGITGEHFHETFLQDRTEAGRPVNFMPVGTALLWAPFYAAGHLVALVTGAPADGFSHPYIAAVAYGSAVYGFLALLLSLAVANHGLQRGAAATVAVWLGTPLVFYMYVAPGYSHACSAFAVSLLLWVWLRVRHRWSLRDGLLLGAVGGLVAMVREQDVLFCAAPALDVLAAGLWRRPGPAGRTPLRTPDAVRCAFAGVVGFAVVYWPQLLAYEALNGHPGPSVLVTRKMNWTAPHFWSVLFSPAHGLFAWTPLALVAVAGLVWLASGRAKAGCLDCRWVGALALLLILLQAYVSGSVESWTVAGAFGQRRFVSLTPLLVLGLAALAGSARTIRPGPVWRVALATVMALGVWWNVGLVVQFGTHTMDRQGLTLRQNARATFIDVPRELPADLWRYFTNRASFFQQPRR
jgi:hypothetical protein